ncbi:hypothetical protein HRW07_08065 [Streptomyces lunaelactis]|uniref:hypothetical protein n=1 Tax=Streptomyces lunaelactis TaxID=1535768 RepID=UPI00158492E1|nr:hypothetical protein [Streptomyces lunaelactis]NUL03196.1 hypothetical protein [Streptomyces lunaelactis]
MAWDEWEQLKSAAADRESAGMQLNQVPVDPDGGSRTGPGPGDLVMNQDDLGAVGHQAFILHGDLSKGADLAGAGMDKHGTGSTMQASSELSTHNFALGSALSTTLTMWDSSLKTLLQACAHISNHLDYTKALHANDDAKIAASLKHSDGTAESWSKINEYFK